MRIASFNLENLFSRARIMNLEDWSAGAGILTEFSRLNTLLQKETYTEADKKEILASIETLGMLGRNEGEYVILRECRGCLIKRGKNRPPEIVADGRDDWVGWLELKTEAVDDIAVRMTAKVVKDVGADILAVIEAEDRIALRHFNDQLLKPVGAAYDGIMLIDGNDDRGIDVGLLTKGQYEIESMVSHVDDKRSGRRIFSRDCPEYFVKCEGERPLLILVNHLKSKGYGAQDDSDQRRKVQAERVREIYDLRRSQGYEFVAVVGDFNDTPDSGPLSPLLSGNSELKDIFDHPLFEGDGRPGTFANGAKSNKIDYILLSPALFQRVTRGGVWRKGVWGGANGTLFPHYEEITQASHAASDHAAIWVDMDLG
ncbi:hypothetical protein LPW11_21040 [Geomonas sp. RF6]|uniref:endonuclease/exonuclease/phosphatase family protein n=1 Tax=Geomonas sp. RF6 TaxID=2897342 RepID=UPI001E3836D6|nr:endonuclease/exonuclease/phosphatase family protein [Geomonas sp. RF6]UFS70344.1 hypothetical protein LPW11_21040 [Geomonas sp. RF6]